MKQVSLIFLFLLGLVALQLLGGCGKGRPRKTDLVSRAYQLIDAQRPQEAILLIESALKVQPENREFKVVLASAYAHKAGFKVQRLVPILKTAQDFQRLQGQAVDAGATKVKPLAFDASSLVNKAGALAEVFDSIPAVASDQVSDLSHAISLLAELGNNIHPADAIYKVILEVILFKHYLVENLLGESPAKNNQELEKCRIEVDLFIENIEVLSNLLINIYADLTIAHPSQTQTFERLTQEASSSVSTLLKTANGISSLDKNSQMFLKFTIIKAGFGKVIKCQ